MGPPICTIGARGRPAGPRAATTGGREPGHIRWLPAVARAFTANLLSPAAVSFAKTPPGSAKLVKQTTLTKPFNDYLYLVPGVTPPHP